ncbi:MAG: hypothetical protein AAF329_25660 [Cyanobacteria bacterium P01_A01_bin.17]
MTQPRLTTQAGLATLIALGLSAGNLTPLLAPQPAAAQIFRRSDGRLKIAEGTRIRTTRSGAKRIIINPDESMPISLTTDQAVRSRRGTVVIPRGSTIRGKLAPRRGGTQFIADSLILKDGGRFNIRANSDVITRTKEVDRGRRTDPIWQGALVGGAATAAISEIFGEAGIFKVLAGSGAGALGGFLLGGRDKAEVRVIDPQTDLDLTLESDLFLSRS